MGKKQAEASAPTTLQTLQQSAAETGVPYTTLRDLVLQGHLPRVQLGDSRRIWVKRADVARLITASTETGGRR